MSWKEPKVEPSPGFFPVSEAEINRKPDLKDLYLAVSSLNMGHGSPVIGVPHHGHRHQPTVTSQSLNSSNSAILVKSEKERQVISSSVHHSTIAKMPYLDSLCDTSSLMPPPFDLPIHKQLYENPYQTQRDSPTLTSTFRVSQNLMPPPREPSHMPPPPQEPSHRDIPHMPPPRESHLMPPPKVIPTPNPIVTSSNMVQCIQVPKVEPQPMTSMPPPPSQGLSIMPPPPHSPNSLRISSTSYQQEKEAIEFDGNDCVLCRVCGDKASGFHYGVHSCEGCKGFFRRSIQQRIHYRPCTKNQQCTILRINRNRCQYCRLKKCMAAGMSRDAVRFGRVPKREKAKINAAMHSSRMKNMETRVMAEMADDAKIIETVVRAHFDTCDYTAEKIKPFIAKAQAEQNFTQCSGMTCPMKGRPEQSFLDQFSERFMNHVRQVCTFAKSIPGFKCLHHDDQVSLLKSCVFEVLLVRLSGLFDNQSLVCLNGDVIKRETISSMPAGNAKFLMDSVFELAQRINRFRLADAEIGLFCAVVIITADRPGLRNPEIVGQMQSKLKMVLQNILVPQHPENSTIFTELMTIIHDLRTLNTLHTEKFLQQARVTGEQVREAAVSRVPTGSPPTQSSLQQHLLYGGVGDWEDNQDRDSTGSRSPQSSDSHTTNNSYSFEDMRRSPMGSVSSSESLGSSETFSKLSVNDLKIHGVGSVLLNALTSPAITATCPNRKRDISRCVSETNIMRQEDHSSLAVERHQETKCPFKARKLDSPSDSGIDSPKAQGSQSTNTSVCSSPRSSMEEKVKEVEEETAKPERSETLEEQHPLLKRALQQPPQPFNMGGVTGFQDEVYHKKFRHSGRKDSNEPTSTQESAKSPSPGPSQMQSHSILASQLAAPPTYTQPIQNSNLNSQSVLASTLSRPIAIPRAKESEQRNEWLANLILEKGNGRSSGQPQSLLMCAPLPAHSNNIPTGLGFDGVRWRGQASTTATTTCSGAVPHPAPGQSRHIPVPVAPTQPTSSLHPAQASPRPTSSAQPQIPSRVQSEASKNPHLKMALSGLPASTDSQPLNLSTRTPPPADIPTEA